MQKLEVAKRKQDKTQTETQKKDAGCVFVSVLSLAQTHNKHTNTHAQYLNLPERHLVRHIISFFPKPSSFNLFLFKKKLSVSLAISTHMPLALSLRVNFFPLALALFYFPII